MSWNDLQAILEDLQACLQREASTDQATLVWHSLEQQADQWLTHFQGQTRFWHSQLACPLLSLPTPLLITRCWTLLASYGHSQGWSSPFLSRLLAVQAFGCFWSREALARYSQTPAKSDIAVVQDPWAHAVKLLQANAERQAELVLLASCSRIRRGQPHWQQLPGAVELVFFYRLALGIQPQAGRPHVGLEHALRLLWRGNLPQAQQQVLQQFLQAFPDLYLLGRFCSDGIASSFLIMQTAPHIKGIAFLQQEPVDDPNWVKVELSGLQLQAPAQPRDEKWLQSLLVEEEHDLRLEEIGLDLQLVRQLNPDWSISRQLRWFERHPELSPYVIAAAEQQTRQQVPIESLRHALAIIGVEQLPQVLALCWLKQQMTRQSKTLAPLALQFSQLLAHALKLFSQQSAAFTIKGVTAEVIAHAIVLPIQQAVQQQPSALASRDGQQSPLLRLWFLACWQQPDIPKLMAQQLAGVVPGLIWQDAALSFRHDCGAQRQFSQQHAAQQWLRFSLMLSLWVFCGLIADRAAFGTAFKNLQQALDLPSYSLDEWRQQLLANSQCHIPI